MKPDLKQSISLVAANHWEGRESSTNVGNCKACINRMTEKCNTCRFRNTISNAPMFDQPKVIVYIEDDGYPD